jgi:hypothetical protein
MEPVSRPPPSPFSDDDADVPTINDRKAARSRLIRAARPIADAVRAFVDARINLRLDERLSPAQRRRDGKEDAHRVRQRERIDEARDRFVDALLDFARELVRTTRPPTGATNAPARSERTP